jgi:hypothetical protein
MLFPIDEFKNRLIKLGLKESTYDEYLPIWIKEYGDSEKSRKDYIWYCYQLLLNTWAQQSSTLEVMDSKQREIYLQMFLFKRKENKKITTIQKAINFCDLQLNKLNSLKCKVIIIGTRDCEQGIKIDRTEITLEEAINTQPIPDKQCKRFGGCVCCYGFEPL